MTEVQFLARAEKLFLHHCSHTSSAAHPASSLMGTRGSFLGGKVARV